METYDKFIWKFFRSVVGKFLGVSIILGSVVFVGSEAIYGQPTQPAVFDLTVQAQAPNDQKIEPKAWESADVLVTITDAQGGRVSDASGSGIWSGGFFDDSGAGHVSLTIGKIPTGICTLTATVDPSENFPFTGKVVQTINRDNLQAVPKSITLSLSAMSFEKVQFQLVSGWTGKPIVGRRMNLCQVLDNGVVHHDATVNSVTDGEGKFVFTLRSGQRYSLGDIGVSFDELGAFPISLDEAQRQKGAWVIRTPTPTVIFHLVLRKEGKEQPMADANGTVWVRGITDDSRSIKKRAYVEKADVSQGMLLLHDLSPGKYQIFLTDAGIRAEDYSIVDNREFTVKNDTGKSPLELNLVLERAKPRVLDVLVKDSDTGKPISGASIECVVDGFGQLKATTDASGHAHFDKLGEGKISLISKSEGYEDEQARGMTTVGTIAEIAMHSYRMLTVNVDFSNGKFEPAEVVVTQAHDGIPLESECVLDNKGNTLVQKVIDGEAYVFVSNNGRIIAGDKVQIHGNAKCTLKTQTTVTTNIVVRMLPEVHAQRILLLRADLRIPGGRSRLDEDGKCSLDVIPGKYSVFVGSEMKFYAIGKIDVVAGKENSFNLNLQAEGMKTSWDQLTLLFPNAEGEK